MTDRVDRTMVVCHFHGIRYYIQDDDGHIKLVIPLRLIP